MACQGMIQQPPEPLKEPARTSHPDQRYTLLELSKTDPQFEKISVDFKAAGMNVSKVEILSNRHLLTRYSTERDQLVDQRLNDPGFKLNEKYLYHGTSAKKSYICDEGLDSRMSKEGCFGKGIYFSDYPKKCIKYAKKAKSEDSHILLVRVILGLPKVYPKGKQARDLKREPEKEHPFKGHRFYDSVQGCPRNYNEFVVYESRRALVEAIISFSKESKGNSKLEQAAKLDDLDDDRLSSNECGDSDTDDNSGLESGNESETEKNEENDSVHTDTDDSDSNTDDDFGDKHLNNEDEIEQILVQKRRIFTDTTGVSDEFAIDRYLLRGNMNVKEAVKIYEQQKAEGFPQTKDDDDDDDDDDKNPGPVNKTPQPNTEEWSKLSDGDKNAVIEAQIDDFLMITGLAQDERDFAKKCLFAVNMNLDLAVLAYYEDLDDD